MARAWKNGVTSMVASDDRLHGLFGAEYVMPAQYDQGGRIQARHSSTHRLMIGVLQDAVEVYRKACDPTRRVSPRVRREVCGWFASHDRQWPFSFERICEALDLDADHLRRALLGCAWRRAGVVTTHAEGSPSGRAAAGRFDLKASTDRPAAEERPPS